MSESENGGESQERKRDLVGKFLSENLTKGELALKHAAGLGVQPSVVPVTDPVLDGPLRPVEVGWHPVGGLAGKWFAEDTGLGKMITEKIHKYPDPTQHWAVLVGDYAHQLWMDENFDVIYTNEKVNREEWHTFKVGETRFNDDAIRRAGESVIQAIRDKRPGYNLITNNCQTYALQLLDAIKVGMRKEFGTTLAVYERLTGSGKVIDLFAKTEDVDQGGEVPAGENTVSLAQQVMDENTTQLDPHEELDKHKRRKNQKDGEDNEDKDRKDHKESKLNSLLSRFTNSTLSDTPEKSDKDGERKEPEDSEDQKDQEDQKDREAPKDRKEHKESKINTIFSRLKNAKSDTQEESDSRMDREEHKDPEEPKDREGSRDRKEQKESKRNALFSRFGRK
ncbi:hypothetical protein EDB80DRAFT_704021 [Ilyonectria destructans]|nr:hypothetical protein EDB80DRAFT_704021 [Ilyonectria destructans]